MTVIEYVIGTADLLAASNVLEMDMIQFVPDTMLPSDGTDWAARECW